MFGGKKRLIDAVLLESANDGGVANDTSKMTSVKARSEACVRKIVEMLRLKEINFNTQPRTVMDMFAAKKIEHGYAAGTFRTKVQDAKLRFSAEGKFLYFILWFIVVFVLSHFSFTGRVAKNDNILDVDTGGVYNDNDDDYFIDGGDDFDDLKPSAKFSEKPLSMASKNIQPGSSKEISWVPVFFMAEWRTFFSNSRMLTVVILLMSGVAYESAARIHVAIEDGGMTLVLQCRIPDIMCEEGLLRLHSDEPKLSRDSNYHLRVKALCDTMMEQKEAMGMGYIVAMARIGLKFACKVSFKMTNKSDRTEAKIMYIQLEELNEPKHSKEQEVGAWVEMD